MNNAGKRILVVDDDPKQREVLAGFLAGRGYRVSQAPDAETTLDRLDHEIADLVLMDVRMPGMGGLEGLARIRERTPAVSVILLTAFADVRDAVEAMRHGAADYLEKPIDLHELAAVVEETIGGAAPAAPSELPALPDGMVVSSDVMRRVLCEAHLVARTDSTVLLTGESGTGKELVAEIIHRSSPRSAGPFLRLNCAAIPPTLVESELFGHVRGAFTGADASRAGRFEAAAGGTLLLDEVGELPLEVQPKLLRVIEYGTFERVGESASRRADVRLVTATNRDLEREVEEKRFREDLFYRINVFRLHLPPLRERREEIAPLVRAFLGRAGKDRARLSPAALRVLEAYEWPGNLRELANVVERAAILATGDVILPEHLPATVRRGGVAGDEPAHPSEEEERPVLTVDEAERRAIRGALERTGGNRTRAAKLLGISRRTLIYRLKEYGGEP
jgi:DNA-binding NtrC family response regulator